MVLRFGAYLVDYTFVMGATYATAAAASIFVTVGNPPQAAAL
jgi:hypothetical protein